MHFRADMYLRVHHPLTVLFVMKAIFQFCSQLCVYAHTCRALYVESLVNLSGWQPGVGRVCGMLKLRATRTVYRNFVVVNARRMCISHMCGCVYDNVCTHMHTYIRSSILALIVQPIERALSSTTIVLATSNQRAPLVAYTIVSSHCPLAPPPLPAI